jgi:hypothetical protein
MFVSTDDALSSYLSKVLSQLQSEPHLLVCRGAHGRVGLCSDWLEKGIVKKLVLVISSVEKQEVLER